LEAITELQHVGGDWQLYKGERAYLSPEVEADGFPEGGISEGWNFAYDGSEAVKWSKVS
jgi:hypothetical protein